MREPDEPLDAVIAATDLLPHLARNAEGGNRLLTWARTGVPRHEYASPAARDAAIEAGSSRPAAALVEDVRARPPASSWRRARSAT